VASGDIFARINKGMNRVMVPLAASSRWQWLVDRYVVVVTYTGRRSGHTFSTPVFYRRRGDRLTIQVALADGKSWWRNFEGDGGPISLGLRGTDRAGHATARRDARGRVSVTVDLEQP
jgi:hypothetical protein